MIIYRFMPASSLPLSRELLGEEEMHTILLQSGEVEPGSQLLVAAEMMVVVCMNYGEVGEDFAGGTLMVDNAIVVEVVEVTAGDDSLAQVMVVKGGGSLA